MAYITLGGAAELTIKVPTNGSTGWGDIMKTDTFQKIAEHDHTAAGKGIKIGTGAISDDAVNSDKIQLANNTSLNWVNAAAVSTAIFTYDSADALIIHVPLKNNTYVLGEDQAGTGSVNLFKVDGGDNIDFGAEVSVLKMKNNINILGRNNAGSGDINMLKVNTSDKLALGADLANAAVVNNVSIQGRNNADSAYVNIVKVNTSDKLEMPIEVVTLNSSALSATNALTLADNTSSATTVGLTTLGTDESCTIHYKVKRNGSVRSGTLEFDDTDTLAVDEYVGDSLGVVFTVSSGDLEYTTTSTGNAATLSCVFIKK